MSMIQVALLRKVDIPTKKQVEQTIRELGYYDFKILDDFETFYGQDGLSCSINGHETFFEIYFNKPQEVTGDNDWIKPDLDYQDTAISFVWGADFAAGACIGLISIALIDKGNA